MEILKIEKKNIKDLTNFITDIGNLDHNSSYLYLILTHYFSNNCLLAKVDNKIAGFITSINTKDNTLFIWQVGVGKEFQKRGIAAKLLQELIKIQPSKISKIEFTISPSNTASIALFKKYAKQIGSKIEKIGKFDQDLFFEKNHEEEIIYQIKLQD